LESPQIRKATTGDIKAIHEILNYYAGQGLLLPRSLSELYDHIRDFFVVKSDEAYQGIHGVCGLGICWEDLAEIKSLAVSEDYQKMGLGRRLVETCLKDARTLGLMKVFTLTYIPDYFERLGFHEVDKSTLPHKVWADCLKCAKFPDCDETAMIIEL
jgi:amino-acid N-acetyltransferase